VAFGGEVDYGVEFIIIKQLFNGGLVTNIALDKRISRIIFNFTQIFEIAGVCQQVIVDNMAITPIFYCVDDEVRTDKPRAACY
jgi:hypothetical protein